MRISLIGTETPTGALVLGELLALGNDLAVLHPASHTLPARLADRVTSTHGTIDDPAALASCLSGADAVVFTCEPDHSLPARTRALVAAMRTAGVRRLIAISDIGVADPRERRSPAARLATLTAQATRGSVFAAHEAAAPVVMDSGLDWTLVRVGRVTERPARGRLRVGYFGSNRIGSSVPREDLARFLAEMTYELGHTTRAPAISN